MISWAAWGCNQTPKLLSLWDMELNRWALLFAQTHALLINIRRLRQNEIEITGDLESSMRQTIEAYGDHIKPLGLTQSSIYLRRVLSEWDKRGFDAVDADNMFGLLHERVVDELQSHYFLYLPFNWAQLYANRTPFGPEAAEAFPSALTDSQSAARCLAVNQGTACVFHCMRVMEVALKALARPLGIPYAPSWESYLRKIREAIDGKWDQKSEKWKRWEPFFRDVSGDLQTIKQAWRNPTMHVVRGYDQDEAAEVFVAVRSFMKGISGKIHEGSAVRVLDEGDK